jgi:hypothetical protein
MGMVGFYARFIHGYGDMAVVLHALKKKGVAFVWNEKHQEAFEKLKRALYQAPVLQVPDFNREFVLATDGSDVAVSAVLQQRVDGVLAPIGYYSRVLTSVERNIVPMKRNVWLYCLVARSVESTSNINSLSCPVTT